MLPLFLDVKRRLSLVVGGGPVGRRKARAIREAGGAVRLVCLEPRPDTADDLDWRSEPFRPEHLDGVSLVFPAATPEVNQQVRQEARRRGLLINGEDFALPATVRRGDFVLALSTGGAAPALARRLRERLESEFDDRFGVWLALLAQARAEIMAQVADPQQRRQLFEQLSDWHWLERLQQEGSDAVRAAMQHLYRSHGNRSSDS